MSVVVEAISPAGLTAEWDRVDVLARCLLQSQSGKEPEPDLVHRLKRLQHQVDRLRGDAAGPWRRLPLDGLPALAPALLACIYAPEVQPRIGWHYQALQPGGAQPFVTPALLHLLLALEDEEMGTLQMLVGAGGELIRRNLVSANGDGVFGPLKADRTALAALLGWPMAEIPPPGTFRVRLRADWSKLVLPPDRERMLREFLLWLRHRETVVGRWGGKLVGGPVAMFSGPSGTGKTFAAGVIAADLGWPLYRVDLARLVSKYIGETEKNIGRLFDAAHGRPMVLQFDEVDALMSKRGEIKEARDRYANMEVSYLLARIEDHAGPCILTTNMRPTIDKAFSRRFQMVVEFPRPDAAARSRLWSLLLPPKAPRHPDLDIEFLGGAVNLTGGNIRNAALHAAYLAAEDGRPLDLGHVATAVWRELAKDRSQILPSDLGKLAPHLPDGVRAAEETS
jgi:hypothetical protein